MTGRDHQDPPAPRSDDVSDLVNHYRAQKDAWREWESQLEKLHHQVLTAAERRAATIVTTARSDIRRILVEARRELLALTAQIREVTGGQDDRDVQSETGPVQTSEAAADVRDRLLSARHDVRRLLDEARPAIEELSEETLAPRQAPRPTLEEERAPAAAPEPVLRDSASSGDAAQAPPSVEDASSYLRTSDGFGDESRERRSRNVLVAVAALLVVAILSGLAWWLRPEPVFIELPAPQAIAPAAGVPAQPPPAPAVEEPPPPAPPQALAPAPAPAPAPRETGAPGSLLILVEARREAWIQSTIDGEADAGRLYPAGWTRRIEGARDVLLRVGDAGAVYVSVNGKEPQILGQDGRIVTRRYTADDSAAPPANPRGQT